jgi:hypothetical protein
VVLCALIIAGVAMAVFATKRRRAARHANAANHKKDTTASMMQHADGVFRSGAPSMVPSVAPYSPKQSVMWSSSSPSRITSLLTGGPSWATASSALPGSSLQGPLESTYGTFSLIAATPVLPYAPHGPHACSSTDCAVHVHHGCRRR